MQWLLVLAGFVFAVGNLISIALLLRSARNYDDHMPDLEEIISPESPKTPAIPRPSDAPHILSAR